MESSCQETSNGSIGPTETCVAVVLCSRLPYPRLLRVGALKGLKGGANGASHSRRGRGICLWALTPSLGDGEGPWGSFHKKRKEASVVFLCWLPLETPAQVGGTFASFRC